MRRTQHAVDVRYSILFHDAIRDKNPQGCTAVVKLEMADLDPESVFVWKVFVPRVMPVPLSTLLPVDDYLEVLPEIASLLVAFVSRNIPWIGMVSFDAYSVVVGSCLRRPLFS